MTMTKKKQKDESANRAILADIRQIIMGRPTYGYRRVTAILNAQWHAVGQDNVNHKRIYRVMKKNDLLLCRYANKPTRVHDGKIITLHSNTRWCSDGFYIPCDNGKRVQVAFSLDTCDREAMKYIASNKGIDGEMVRDLMTETMAHRFGQVNRLPSRTCFRGQLQNR
jgi:transposase InsO family protein